MSNQAERYSRHFSLPEVGRRGQRKLSEAKVLVVGAGGLGSSLLYYLAAAGVGKIGIIDGDRVELSNLQRQILFDPTEVGGSKADLAKHKLSRFNPEIQVESYPYFLQAENALGIIADYDIIADASDNFASRYLVNDACRSLKKTEVYAGIFRFQGQASVFSPTGACYRCLYPKADATAVPNCAEAGVLGVLPGLFGCIQANEVLKCLLGIGESLQDRLLSLDALSMRWQETRLSQNPACPLCAEGRIFSELERNTMVFCTSEATIQQLSVEEYLKNYAAAAESHFLLDVREPLELNEGKIEGSVMIPLAELEQRLGELPKDKMIVVQCRSGGRSNKAAGLLKTQGFTQVCNLAGGIQAWNALQKSSNLSS